MSGRNKSTNGLRFLKENEWIKMGKPIKIKPHEIPNIEEKIALLDKNFNLLKILKNKKETAEYEGYSCHSNNNIFTLKHNLILSTKNGNKCVYYDDYEKYKKGELVLVNPNIPKCKTILLVNKNYTEEDIEKLLKKPSWWKNRSLKRSLQKKNILSYPNKDLEDKTVLKFSFDGELLEEYKNATEASKRNNVSVYALSSCLNYKSYTCGGYIWIYKEAFSKEILEEKMKVGRKLMKY